MIKETIPVRVEQVLPQIGLVKVLDLIIADCAFMNVGQVGDNVLSDFFGIVNNGKPNLDWVSRRSCVYILDMTNDCFIWVWCVVGRNIE